MNNKPTEYLIAHIGHTGKHCEHICWWRPESRGYTLCVDQAGRYTEAQAASICDRPDSSCIAVAVDSVKPLARSTPYFRMNNGDLRALYDFPDMKPVPNTRECWDALIQAKSYPASLTHQKPTPIGAKARAIYIDKIERGEA
jgi:hypothetical protein